ncbi:TetR family transcriptional regulator [Paractinoplanes deccanensis]|uniref:TetR family transcriptional regulator n=1 Tax=Paractinoplanes deccanensis TaxID=113561 RepID=A0ABQ3XVE3_9ACTN|nr:TetR/AcrR family transcriptional regulator [Actinoplanes deccanensis]GID71714.1 TetR family transcriptional regulator [Actinoplanes deccanensis]
MIYGVQAPRRRDAQRNRLAILEAASDLMTGRADIAGMPEIARRAGVGQATLYRHFPDRYALTSAVIAHQVERLEACVTANQQQPAAFRPMLDAVLRSQVAMRPLVHLARRLEPAVQGRYLRQIVTLLAGPLQRAQEQGHVRRDLVPADLMVLFGMVEGVAEGMLGDAGDQTAKAIELALDGLMPLP